MDKDLKSYIQSPDGFCFMSTDFGSLDELIKSITKKDCFHETMSSVLETRRRVLTDQIPATPIFNSPITKCLEKDLCGENVRLFSMV
jgi:hypothetical protein